VGGKGSILARLGILSALAAVGSMVVPTVTKQILHDALQKFQRHPTGILPVAVHITTEMWNFG